LSIVDNFDSKNWIAVFKTIWNENEPLHYFIAKEMLDVIKTEENNQQKDIKITTPEIKQKDNQISLFSSSGFTQEQIEQFEELTISCDSCKLSQEECLKRGKSILKLLSTDKEQMDQDWNSDKNLRPCTNIQILRIRSLLCTEWELLYTTNI